MGHIRCLEAWISTTRDNLHTPWVMDDALFLLLQLINDFLHLLLRLPASLLLMSSSRGVIHINTCHWSAVRMKTTGQPLIEGALVMLALVEAGRHPSIPSGCIRP